MVYYLPFNHYLNILKKTMKLMERADPDRQSMLQIALISMLDHFHYDLRLPVTTTTSTNTSTNKANTSSEEEEEEGDVEERGEEEAPKEPKEEISQKESSPKRIADVVIQYIFPTVKSWLMKETTDQDNKKTKVVQTNIAIALTNLLKQLQPPLISPQQYVDIFSNLILGIIDTLKSKDVNIRDAARQCLTKMVHILGFQAFERIIYEMQSMLTQGYQRHVLLYSLRSILIQVTEQYQPPLQAKRLTMTELEEIQQQLYSEEKTSDDRKSLEIILEDWKISLPEFDQCVPLLMKGVLLDMSDNIREEREEIEGIIRKSTIREMKGSKYNELLEVMAKNILFRPTYALLDPMHPSSLSSIHAMATPLLEFLTNAEEAIDDFTEATRVGRVAEGLQRISQGLAKNPSVDPQELLLYIHASLQPFVTLMLKQYRKYKQSIGKIVYQATDVGVKAKINKNQEKNRKRREKRLLASGATEEEIEEKLESVESDLELVLPSYLREDSSDEEETFEFMRQEKSYHDEVTGYQAASWLPTDWNARKEQREVIEERNRAQKELIRVQDGASAPRMTGRNRYDKAKRSASANNGIEKPTLLAIKFCLTLLTTCLKKGFFKSPTSIQSTNNAELMDVADPASVTSLSWSKEELQEMLVPFIPILRSFLHLPNAAEIVILSIKSLTQFINNQIPFEPVILNKITNRILMIMVQYNISKITAENELCQVCIQLLLAIFRRYNQQHRVKQPMVLESEQFKAASDHRIIEDNEQQAMAKSRQIRPLDFPLPEFRMKLLLEALIVAITESNHSFQVTLFQLIREILKTHLLLPEIYLIMDKILPQIVLSHYKNIRLLSSKMMIEFLLSYPLTKKKHEQYVDQLLQLGSFEYETGRLSAYETIYYILDHFPLPVIEDYSMKLFLHLTLSLSHESTKERNSVLCQAEIMKILILLFQKIAERPVLIQQIENYLQQWLNTILKLTQASPLSSDWVSWTMALKQQVTREMMELVIIGCKIATLFLKSLVFGAGANQQQQARQKKRKLTKHQKEIMRQVYLLVYENLLLVLQFHFASANSAPPSEEDYLLARLKAINHPIALQIEEERKQSSSASGMASFFMIPLEEQFWYLLYQLLVVFETSYEWNTDYLDTLITTIDLSSLPTEHTSLIELFSASSSSTSNSSATAASLLVRPSDSSEQSQSRTLKPFMELVCELLLYNHPWIRSVSLRILSHYLEYRFALPISVDEREDLDSSRLSLTTIRSSFSAGPTSKVPYLQRLLQQKEKRLSTSSGDNNSVLVAENELLLQSNSFYFIGRKLCMLLNQSSMKIDYLLTLKKSMLWLLQGMWQYPALDTLSATAIGTMTQNKKKISTKRILAALSAEGQGTNKRKREHIIRLHENESEEEKDQDDEEEDDEESNDQELEGEEEEVEFEAIEKSQNKDEALEVIAGHVQTNDTAEQVKFEDNDDNEEDEDQSSDAKEDNEENQQSGDTSRMDQTEKKAEEEEEEGDEDEDNDGVFFEDTSSSSGFAKSAEKRGIVWMMNRLRAIGADRRSTRRIRVLQLFLELVQLQPQDFLQRFIPQIMEIPIRVVLSQTRIQQQQQQQQLSSSGFRGNANSGTSTLITIDGDITKIPLDQLTLEENYQWQYLLSTHLLKVLEEKLSPEDYLSYYTQISTFLQQKRLQKKVTEKEEAISNPRIFAEKRMERSRMKVMDRKRKTSNFMAQKGKRRKLLR